MDKRNAARAAKQDRVVSLAVNGGLPWDGDEVAVVRAGGDVEVVAIELGRTVYAVEAVKQALREGREVGGGHGGRRDATTLARAVAPTWTFVGDDVPPGW